MLKENGLTDNDILKIKIWNSGFPLEMPKCNDDKWRISHERYAVSIENPDFINIDDQNNKNFNFVVHLFQVTPFFLRRVNLRVGLAKKALRKTPRGGGEQL